MKTLTIGDTVFNLSYLISVKYKAKSKAVAPRGGKSSNAGHSDPAGPLKSASSLELHFLDCDTIHLKKDKADAVWSKLSVLLDIDQEESPPETEISTPS